jgi:hypothetical protein
MPIYENKLVNLIFRNFFMKKLLLSLVSIGLLSNVAYAKKITQMNKKGWKFTEVIGGLQGAFGMVMTRER